MPAVHDLTLPAPALRFIPHRPPMLQIDTLDEVSPEEAVVSARVDIGNLLVDAQTGLADVGLIEMLAQAYAARQGYADMTAGLPIRGGYLVGLRGVRLLGRARIGDHLRISLRTLMSMDGFALVEGTVQRNDELLAEGTLKLWILPPEKGLS